MVQRKSMLSRLLFGLFFCLAAVLAMGSKEPLDGVHWDSPIHLYQGKRFAETHFLDHYALHAREVALQVEGNWPKDESFSEAYWRFARLGHIALLGSLVGISGTNVGSIHLVTWVYRILQALGLTFAVILVISLEKLISNTTPKAVIIGSAAFAGFLYLCSDIWRYLYGNLISEIPAMVLWTGAALALTKALQLRSRLLALGSGVLAFLLYAVRMESIVPWGAFVVFLALAMKVSSPRPAWWRELLCSLGTSLILYLGYAWWFYPLADPALFYHYMRNLGGMQEGEPTYKLLVVVGGIPWVGVIVALASLRRSRLVVLPLAWLLLTMLPMMPSILWGLSCQSRMMFLVVPPLLMVSAMGWAVLFDQQAKQRKLQGALLGGLCAVALALAVSWPGTYGLAKDFPGKGFLDGVRSFLVVPSYEKLHYPVLELAQLSQAIYGEGARTVLLWSPEIPQEYLNITRYLGPGYPPDADVVMRGDPTNKAPCDQKEHALVGEPVTYCNQLSEEGLLEYRRSNLRVLLLRPNAEVGETMPYTTVMEWVPLLQTENFQLSTAAYGAASEQRREAASHCRAP
jgi:hypothetical protein